MQSLSEKSQSWPVRLTIRGIGPIAAFKNRKRMFRGKLVTDPEVKQRMDRLARAIESQLLSLMQQSTGETLTAQQVRYWMQCNWPGDDCWTVIPELIVSASQGDDGAIITVERIT